MSCWCSCMFHFISHDLNIPTPPLLLMVFAVCDDTKHDLVCFSFQRCVWLSIRMCCVDWFDQHSMVHVGCWLSCACLVSQPGELPLLELSLSLSSIAMMIQCAHHSSAWSAEQTTLDTISNCIVWQGVDERVDREHDHMGVVLNLKMHFVTNLHHHVVLLCVWWSDSISIQSRTAEYSWIPMEVVPDELQHPHPHSPVKPCFHTFSSTSNHQINRFSNNNWFYHLQLDERVTKMVISTRK
jgi:hypothetical protein